VGEREENRILTQSPCATKGESGGKKRGGAGFKLWQSPSIGGGGDRLRGGKGPREEIGYDASLPEHVT